MALNKTWPPSPCVEDEEVSLAREHGSDSSDSDSNHGRSPAISRGSIDQYPLIVDVNAKPESAPKVNIPSSKRPGPPAEANTDPEPRSSRAPHIHNADRRFVHIPSTTETLGVPLSYDKPRSKSTSRAQGDDTPRGRPNMHRLQTDLGVDSHAIPGGQRRAPSPHSYRPQPTLHQVAPQYRLKPSLLSPESANGLHPTESRSRRSRSAHPVREAITIDSSDSDRKTSHHNHRSKSRHDRRSRSKHGRASEEESISHRRADRSDNHRRTEHSRPRARDSEKVPRQSHGNITPPQTPTLLRESPYVSAAEESDRRRRGTSRRPERRRSKESPHTSSAEEAYKQRDAEEQRYGKPSRRSSMRQAKKPYLDLSDRSQHAHLNVNTPQTAKSPITMEDYFQRAFEDNKTRQSQRTSQYSAHPSPFSSPPTSPPRTPRGDRSVKDYFEANAPASPAKQSRSRPAQTEDNQIKPLSSLLGAATLGAATLGASLATKISNPSRSSTTSLEVTSSGSQSSMPSAQRSRKPSPIFDEPQPTNQRPGSRLGSFTGKDEMPAYRPNNVPDQRVRPGSRAGSFTGKEELSASRGSLLADQHNRPGSRAGSVNGKEELPSHRTTALPDQYARPVSRAGSTTGRDEYPHYRSSPLPGVDERPSSRNGPVPTHSMEAPHPTLRSSSYSSYDQQRTRPRSQRLYTTNSSATIIPASSHHPPPGPSHLSRMSSSSSTISERDFSQTAPPTPTAVPEPREISFPPCPQPYPVKGHHQWYTILGLQNFDICKSCASVVGNSEFRGYCAPSWKPQTESITCALSRPWIRLAVARALQERSANVNLLQQLNTVPAGMLPCPGASPDARKWYHIMDPATKEPIVNFDACAACVRAVELLFPELYRDKLFERPINLVSERTCNLRSGSKHFYPIMTQMDKLASYCRKKDLRSKDIAVFATFMKQKTRFPECQNDAMLATPMWHYMPGLPELTICAECYHDIVMPLKGMPIARDITPTLQKVPVQRPDNYVAGISCQLYSDRMRAIFKDSCIRHDFEGLRRCFLMRYNVEHKLQEKHRMLELEMAAGIDRREEMERNSALWKTYE